MIKAPRGTQDIYGDNAALWQYIESLAIETFNQAGFQELRTPIFESSELFNSAVGESSDIVNKEMYSFNDRSDRSLTLRPEGTAGIVRAFIENSFDREGLPSKIWYRGPMFRYERPQTGRYRQFHQIGIEAIGAKAPVIDLEIIKLGVNFINKLGLKDLKLHINTLGNKASREAYIKALKKFLESKLSSVCEDCQRRFEQNPLRCLDCKVPEDQKIYQEAPSIHEYLDDESKEIWQKTQNGLKELGIDFLIDEKLVRGLDYYTHIVFELKASSDKLAAQNTVLAGGRYDNLIENLGSKTQPAVGWALGLERIATLLEENKITKEKLFIISDNPIEAMKLADKLRSETKDIVIEFATEEAKFKKQLDKALKRNYRWALFYLEEERKSGELKLKNLLENKEYDKLNYDKVLEILKNV